MAFEQLPLPFREASRSVVTLGIPKPKRVFVNRDLHLTGAEWIGFDMDYTLAVYDQPEMDRLSVEATVHKLIARGYPQNLADVAYDTQFPIRGLVIDKRFGHILKMDRYKVVQRGYHGMRKLTRDEIRSLYHSKKIKLTAPRYHWIDTLYALSEAAVYAGIVEAFERQGVTLDYGRLFTDIRECIDEAHRDGTILNAVLGQLARYIARDAGLASTLHKFRSAGRKLFLLTNSRWSYTDQVMTYLLGDCLPEYPSWRHYFDVVVVAAQKPAFFQQRRPFFERQGDGLEPATLQHERGKVFEGGNLRDLERLLGVSGDRVLYVGDHIYGDILRSKKESAWRTAMIVQELEAEILAHEACAEDQARHDELEATRTRLEDELRYHQARYKQLNRALEGDADDGAPERSSTSLDSDRMGAKRAVDRVRALMREIDEESAMLRSRIDTRFHPYWGSLLKEAAETSSFGDQVEEYACLYTSRVSNFLCYSPLQYFRSPRDLMPHEL